MTLTNKIVDPSWDHIKERDKRIEKLKNALRNCKSELLCAETDLIDMRHALSMILNGEY